MATIFNEQNILSKRLKGIIWNLAYLSGFITFLQRIRAAPSHGGVIFYYHRVHPCPGWDPVGVTISLSLFRRQMALIKKKFPVPSLGEFFEQLKKSSPASEAGPAVVISFDDGYRDVWELAWPILKDLQIIPALFVCTDPLIRRIPLLWDLLTRAVQTDGRDHIATGSDQEKHHLRTRKEKESFVREMNQRWLGLGGMDQLKAFNQLFAPIAEPIIRKTADLYLNQEEIRECLKAGLEIGAHTASHPYLPLLPEREWGHEIQEPKAELEALLGVEVPFFSYPAGKVSQAVRDYVARSGYQGALATGKQAVYPGPQDLFRLPRISPEGVISIGKFFALVSGVKREWFH